MKVGSEEVKGYENRISQLERMLGQQGLNRCLEALGVSKGTWHYRMRGGSKQAERKARDEALRTPLVEVIRAHPSYGYRRIRPDLEEAIDQVVNGKRLRRLLDEWELNLHRTTARSSPSEIRRILKQAEGPCGAGIESRQPVKAWGRPWKA